MSTKAKGQSRRQREIEEAEERIATIVGSWDGAWSAGVCDGLSKAVQIAINHDAPIVALAIAEDGFSRFGDKMAEMLRMRKIDLANFAHETCATRVVR